MLLIPRIKRRESKRDAVRRRLGLLTKKDVKDAVRAAERILRG